MILGRPSEMTELIVLLLRRDPLNSGRSHENLANAANVALTARDALSGLGALDEALATWPARATGREQA